MARSVGQIREALKSVLRSINNSLDLDVGPLYNYLIRPVATPLAALEERVDNLKRFYSRIFADVASPQEALDFANNFGTAPDIGSFARVRVIFYRSSPPPAGQIYTVPIGGLVATADNSLVYRVMQTTNMFGDFASSYLNTARGRYEVQVLVEAIAPGIIYNVPPNRIRRIMTTMSGFEGVQQFESADGGTEAEDSRGLARRVQQKFTGLDRLSMSGISVAAKAYAPTLVGNAQVVRPTDRMEFRRITNGPAADLYVDGFFPTTFTEEYLAIGGETSILLTGNPTTTAVSTVAVNGIALSFAEWTFVEDSSLEYQGSTRAAPKIQLTLPLLPNDIVEIIGLKNSLLDELQLLYGDDNGIFKTDILVRTFLELPIIVKLELQINSGDADDIRDQVESIVASYVTPPGEIPELLLSEQLKESIRSSIPEVGAIKVLEFRRKIGALDQVETITRRKNQVPRYDTLASAITVRS